MGNSKSLAFTQTDTEALQSVSGFNFSGASIADLEGADAYTIVNILVDESGSVSGWQQQLDETIKNTVAACQKHPLAESILVRVAAFDDRLREIHGFVALSGIDPAGYNGAIKPNGSTALYDAALESIDTTRAYGAKLITNRYTVNGISFVVTDGGENASVTGSIAKIKAALQAIRTSEQFESFKIVLVGVGQGNDTYFQQFASDCGFDQYVNIGDATPQRLAKLADFVSKSVSASSTALGTGGPSQNITF